MQTLTYELTFLSPAFLGNAEQSAQWRTPPIKSLLRQWWRVVYAGDCRHAVDLSAMRVAEGQLFGVAADERGGSRRSQLRLRLDTWKQGGLTSWNGLEAAPVEHPEVERAGRRVGPHVYLGFGPLTVAGRSTELAKKRAAIQAGDNANLRIATSAAREAGRVRRALWLIDRFGALGGRSRNGWGSLSLRPLSGTPPLEGELDATCTLPWQAALGQDWPLGIGTSSFNGQSRPLVWQTGPFSDWKQLMRRLAEVKIALRRQFLFPQERSDGQVHERHWLSYPVTTHKVLDWERTGLRLPNSLRFKLRADADGRLRGVIFHMPCLPPPAFSPVPRAIERVWQQVHAHLDADATLARIPG